MTSAMISTMTLDPKILISIFSFPSFNGHPVITRGGTPRYSMPSVMVLSTIFQNTATVTMKIVKSSQFHKSHSSQNGFAAKRDNLVINPSVMASPSSARIGCDISCYLLSRTLPNCHPRKVTITR